MIVHAHEPLAYAGGKWATDLVEVSSDWSVLESQGLWIGVVPYEGVPRFLRFETWSEQMPVLVGSSWKGPDVGSWTSSMDRDSYIAAVEATREAVAAGQVYQANICRVLRAPLGDLDRDIAGLHSLLMRDNPAPFAFMLRVPELDLHIASASPELFLSREDELLISGPIKGTGRTLADLTDKDRAENIMIVDLVRNDLARVSQVGTVEVPHLLQEEQHPGLVHLVSQVSGQLIPGTSWEQIFDSTFPPGSVTGAPKSTALKLIATLEPAARSWYCGAMGWIDVDADTAALSVGIRSFWIEGDELCFGTGAGITWLSDAAREWAETELKAGHLTAVASRQWSTADGRRE
ncbi:MAG: chorismate-binding protein [Actinomycetota bacterium]|nr:chorismate-binding protein [Actinomycetota bacterium]